jgi:hypothetical protein
MIARHSPIWHAEYSQVVNAGLIEFHAETNDMRAK